MTRLRSSLLALVAILLIAGSAWYILSRPDETIVPDYPQRLETVTVAQVGELFVYMPLYYAADRGYFSRHGLDVRFVTSGGDERSVAAVVAGAADLGVGDPTFAAIASERGQPVRVVASVLNGVPFWGVARDPSIPTITTPAGLRGHTIATFPSPSTAYTLQARMFREGGLQPSIREAAFGSLLPLLDRGAVDIALELEPNVSTEVAQGGHVVYSLAERYPDFTMTGVTVTSHTITARPEMVRAFVAALDEAERAAHANPTDAIAVARQRFPTVQPAIVDAAMRRMLASRAFPPGATVSDVGWRQAIGLRIDSGDLRSATSGDGVVDNRFIPPR